MRASDNLQDVIGADYGVTSPQALVQAVMIEWGGPSGFAQELRDEFMGLPNGHSSRIKIQTLILQALLKFGGEGDDDGTSLEQKKQLLEQAVREFTEIKDD